MKKLHLLTIICILYLSYLTDAAAQNLTLEECQTLAKQNFPLTKQYALTEKIKDFNLKNASKSYLPQLQLKMQASYQSATTELPINLPNISVMPPDKDQYKAVIELQQLIWDGGRIKALQKLTEHKATAEHYKVEKQIYTLRKRINEVYFGLLLINEQLAIQQKLEEKLQRNHDKIANYLTNGVANISDISEVKAAQIRASQQRIQMEARRLSYLQILGLMIGKKLNKETRLEKPKVPFNIQNKEIKRPELQYFEAQQKLLNAQNEVAKSGNYPTIGLFAQGGYGKPALNLFENKINPFFIGGVRLKWNISSFYTSENTQKKITTQKQSAKLQQELFLYELKQKHALQNNEKEQYQAIMQDDDELVSLQEIIKKAMEAKVENGVANNTELLDCIHDLEKAKQMKALHEIQYLLACYNLKYLTNN